MTCPLDRRNVLTVAPSYALRSLLNEPLTASQDQLQPTVIQLQDLAIQNYPSPPGCQAPRPIPSMDPGISVRTLFSFLSELLRGQFAQSWLTILLFILTLLYVFSPFDLLPEALIGPIGFLDDILFFLGMSFVFFRGRPARR